MPVKSAATILRQKLEGGEFILAPGVYDGFSARIALQVGFDALYMVPSREGLDRSTNANSSSRQEQEQRHRCMAKQISQYPP